VAQLVEDSKVNAVLSCADGYGIELEVQTTGVESSVVELLEPWDLSEGKSRRVTENTLARLEADTDDEDARASRASSTSGAAAVELLGQSGRAIAHELCGTFEDRQVGVVGEEVERVDRDAVTTNTKTGTESLVAIWFCCGGVDHLVGVDTVSACSVGHLIDIGNVDHAIAVLEKLGHLSHFGLADGYHLFEDASVQLVDN
jgi:hypothetical protein